MTDPAIPTDPADRPDPISPPETIHVTIDPSRLYAGYNSTLSDLILEACATKVMESFQRDEAVTDLRRRVTAIRDEEIRAHLAPVVADAIAASLQPTDAFGQAKGTPKTLREVILEQAIDFLRKPADSSSYNSSRTTYVQALIQKEVGRAVEAEMRKALDEGRTQIHDALKAKGAEMLEKALVELAQKGVSA